MKTSLKLLLAALIGTLFASVCFAQDAAPVPVATLPDSVVAWLTPIIVPLVLAGLKKLAPKIPSALIPLGAPVLGVLIGLINNLVSSQPGNLWLAAGLGLLGVAVREVKEAFRKAENGGWPVAES